MTVIRSSAIAALVAGIGFSGLAAAQSNVWNFGDTAPNGACTGNYDTLQSNGSGFNGIGNTINCTQQPNGTVNTLAVKAYSAATGIAFASAAVNQWGTGSGFGVRNANEPGGSGAPDHAMDNNAQSDLLLLSFTSAQILKTVTLGWSGTDADFQLLRWTQAGAATATVGRTATQLLSDGWGLVSTVDGAANISTPDVIYGVNTGNLSSSYWLISAFNSAFGASGSSAGIDAFKVLGVTSSAVAEPGSLALAGLALAAAAGLRRRGARQDA